MCHEPAAAPDVGGRAELMTFFIAQASRLALHAVGDDQAFVLMHNGAAIRQARQLAPAPVRRAAALAEGLGLRDPGGRRTSSTRSPACRRAGKPCHRTSSLRSSSGTLAVLNVLNFVDRFLIQGFAVDLMADLHLSNLQFTLLTGLAFTLFYTLAGLFMGVAGGSRASPATIAAGLGAWTVLTAATGFVTGFAQLAALRTLTGIGEATLTPAALGLLADTQAPRRRALATGIYYLGAPLGIGGAFLLASALGATIGWRHAFHGAGRGRPAAGPGDAAPARTAWHRDRRRSVDSSPACRARRRRGPA